MRGVVAKYTCFMPLPISSLRAIGMLLTAIWLLGTTTLRSKVAL